MRKVFLDQNVYRLLVMTPSELWECSEYSRAQSESSNSQTAQVNMLALPISSISQQTAMQSLIPTTGSDSEGPRNMSIVCHANTHHNSLVSNQPLKDQSRKRRCTRTDTTDDFETRQAAGAYSSIPIPAAQSLAFKHHHPIREMMENAIGILPFINLNQP